jgi:hypothetical protein
MNKILMLGIGVLMFVGVAGFARAQTATPTATPTSTVTATPTPSTTVPAGAPSTGFGK